MISNLKYPLAIASILFIGTIIGFSTTTQATLAYFAGVVIGGLSFLVLNKTVDLLKSEKPTEKSAKFATIFIVSAFLIKIPLIGVIAYFVWQLHVPGPSCFGIGVVSVYFAAIGLAVVSTPTR